MEFRQFRYILTTAREGTISKAAQKLYISQPSLSQLIAGVEKKNRRAPFRPQRHAAAPDCGWQPVSGDGPPHPRSR